jgi:hypothetical protein
MYMTRTLLTVAFDCMESHIEAHYHARSHASSASLTFFTAPSTHLRHDNLNAHIPWPNPPRHQRWQQTRWLRLPAQHHLNRGLQVLQRRPPRRSHLQCHPNHQMQLPTPSPLRPPRTYQLRAQHRLHNLHPLRLRSCHRIQP